MEPFGLFQFLQNLLTPSTPSEENSTPAPSPESEPSNSKRTEPPPLSHENAAAQFLENHEKRAGRSPSPKR